MVCMVCMVSGVCFRDGTLSNTLSGCVTQDPRASASEASAIHPTHTKVCVWNVDMLCAYIKLTLHLHPAR